MSPPASSKRPNQGRSSSDETCRLAQGYARFEPVGPLILKGKTEPIPAYRLLEVSHRRLGLRESPSPRTAVFVNRESELAIRRDPQLRRSSIYRLKQQRLYFLPLPQGQGSLRPTFPTTAFIGRIAGAFPNAVSLTP